MRTLDVGVGPIHGPRSQICRHERPSAERRPGGPTSSPPPNPIFDPNLRPDLVEGISWVRPAPWVTVDMGDGDGWTRCALGHRHWGRFGAAGLLVVWRVAERRDENHGGSHSRCHGGDEVLLQHRAPNTHGGASWALPGGARDSHEDALAAALREASEETTLDVSTLTPTAHYTDDHGGWSYTTVLANSRQRARVEPNNWESDEMRWWPLDEVAALDLHHGFAAAWPQLRDLLATDAPDVDDTVG